MSVSSFICLSSTGPERNPPSNSIPQAVAAKLERIETAVLTLAEVEHQRLAERGDAGDWEAALRKVGFRLRTERPVSDGPAEGDQP